jgi:hypothetical protein
MPQRRSLECNERVGQGTYSSHRVKEGFPDKGNRRRKQKSTSYQMNGGVMIPKETALAKFLEQEGACHI